jgi:hypothetical protein
MLAIILVQEFRFEPSHVHIRRTLAFAGLAFQAQIECLEQGTIREAAVAELAGNREAESVRPAARAVLLFASGLIRGAHRSVALFSALTDTGT